MSARNGQTAEIAAYTVVTAALAFVAIAVSGGSSVLYLSGTTAQRQAVRSQWVFVVMPAMAGSTVVIGLFYRHHGYYWPPLLAAGAVTFGNSLAALQLGDLSREMRFTANAVVVCGSKLISGFLVIGGMRLTFALLVGAALQFLFAEFALRHTSWMRREGLRTLSPRSGFSVFRANRRLLVYTATELYNGRVGTLMLSFFVTPRVMGCYGAVASAYQALGGVLCSGLQVSMVAKSRVRHGIDARGEGHPDAEIIALAGATVVAVAVAMTAPVVTGHILRLPIHESAQWLRITIAALPFMILNRSATYSAIGDGDYRRATRIVLLVAALMTPIFAVVVPLAGPAAAASAGLVGESITALVVVVVVVGRRYRTRGSGRHRSSDRPVTRRSTAR